MIATTLVEGAKSIVRGKHKDDAPKLQAAVENLRKLQSRYVELRNEADQRVDISYFNKAETAAAEKYRETRKPEDLREWCLRELVAEKARRTATIANYERLHGIPDSKFRSEHPEFRSVLGKVCDLKLQIARGELSRITSEEAQRLSGQGFDDEQIDKSPVVARARGVVQAWEFRVKKIQDDLPEVCWKENIDALLEEK